MTALFVVMVLLSACSTQKNTPKTRFWHAFNAKYNTYYNGSVAYIDGSLEKEKGNVDNFTEMLPLYTVGNKGSREIGKSNFDRAIEKSQKAIHQHSITRRPVWDKSRRKTAKDIEWLNRREYNPFLWKAWMLMGRSQFHKGAFDEAASTFSYMSRIYRTQPAIYGKARAWLAKSYIEQGWMYDAEDVIRNIERDSIHWRAQKEWDYTYADYHLHAGNLEQAAFYLRRVIRHEMRSKQRAREWFLLGQIQAAMGNNQEAYKCFRRVLRQNPPYELQFNARIAMTEVMGVGQSKKMIARLKRMAANDNNAQFLDQVYYAIGNIYLHQHDTLNAISAYERGNSKSQRNGIEKGVLLLHLGDLYWQKEQYSDAHRCYGEAIGLLDKDRDDYAELSARSVVLDKLVPHTEAIHLQDSLQELARMSEPERNKVIDRAIEAYKKKLREERRAQSVQNGAGQDTGNGMDNTTPAQANTQQSGFGQQSQLWYFYNPVSMQQGKNSFQQQWGKRENIDNWRRSNQTVVASDENFDNLTEEQEDSIAAAREEEERQQQAKDSVQNNPLKREYYLAQIPFTDEQMQQSNMLLQDGLYNAGVIFKDQMDNLSLSSKYLYRLLNDFPGYEHRDDVWYHLYLLHSRRGELQKAEVCLDSLKAHYADSQWTIMLTDPHYVEDMVYGKHLEDSLYADTYNAFLQERYTLVHQNAAFSSQRYPKGAHRDKFIFVEGLTLLNEGNATECLTHMETVVSEYPTSELAELAGMIVNGVKAGRRLRGGKFDMGNVWQRRSSLLNDNDSTEVKQFVNDRTTPFVFMYAYQPDSINENQLLFEVARYNFTSYLVRSFDIEIEDDGGLHRMKISGFRSYDEAHQYARELHRQQRVVSNMQSARPIIISEKNLPLLGTVYSYDEYAEYYAQHFAPLKISTFKLLQEPAEVTSEKEKELTVEEVDSLLDDEVMPGEDNSISIEDEELPGEDSALTIEDEELQDNPVDTGFEIEDDAQPSEVAPESVTVADDDVAEPVSTEQTDILEIDSDDLQQENDADGGLFDISDDEELPAPAAVTQPSPSQHVQTVAPEHADDPAEQQARKPQLQTVIETPAEDTGIYFDDGFGIPPATTEPSNSTKKNDKRNDKPQKFDLEDEYYDLDGF